jgi:hypothetical protein
MSIIVLERMSPDRSVTASRTPEMPSCAASVTPDRGLKLSVDAGRPRDPTAAGLSSVSIPDASSTSSRSLTVDRAIPSWSAN